MIITLTNDILNNGLVVEAGKNRQEFCDATCPGLLVEVRASAESIPTYYLRFKRNGKTAYDRLGTIRDLTLTQARKLAAQKKVEYAPLAKAMPEQKPAVGEMTLDTFWTEHYYPQAKLHKRSWIRDDQLYRLRIAPKFGDKKLSEVTRQDVLKFQNELADGKLSPASQDHHIKLMRRLLNYAVELELLERNPLKGIKLRLVNNELHDVADADGLQRYIEVLRTDSNRPVCNILMFLLTTGARLGEVQKMTDDQLDREKGLWTIPAANAKSKKSRTVPLNESAMFVLAEAYKLKKSEYVFANPATGKPFTTITRVRHRLQKLAGVTMRAHSLRHQFADMLLAGGRSLYDVQVLLGHSDPRVSQRYARLSMNALQQASSVASILVPKTEPPVTPVAVPLAETSAVPKQDSPKETPASNVVPFLKVAA